MTIRALAFGALAALAACAPGTGVVSGPGTPTGKTHTEELFVASSRVRCMGVGPRDCMQVRNTPQQEWRLFYDDIDGFTYEPGYDYRLKVQVSELTDVPADASSLNYRLIDTIAKTRAKPTR